MLIFKSGFNHIDTVSLLCEASLERQFKSLAEVRSAWQSRGHVRLAELGRGQTNLVVCSRSDQLDGANGP